MLSNTAHGSLFGSKERRKAVLCCCCIVTGPGNRCEAMRRISCPPCTWWGSRGLQTWRGSECRAGAVCRHSSCGAHPLLGHKSYVSKKKLSTTTTTHTRAHIAHINFKRWRDTRDHTASWPREAFANEAGLTHASSPPAARTVCPSSETASSLLAGTFRKANYLASTVRQSASMSISFRLQLHHSERRSIAVGRVPCLCPPLR